MAELSMILTFFVFFLGFGPLCVFTFRATHSLRTSPTVHDNFKLRVCSNQESAGSAHELIHIEEAVKLCSGSSSQNCLNCYFEHDQICTGVCPIDGRKCDAKRNYLDHVYGSRAMPAARELYTYQLSDDGQEPIRVVNRRPYQFPVPIEADLMKDILPNRSQGKSWMANAVIDLFKILIKIRDTVRDSYL